MIFADQSLPEDMPWGIDLPADQFSAFLGGPFDLTITQWDGRPLPSWLSLDADTRRLAGTPPRDFNGTLRLAVTATNATLTEHGSFALTVTPVNDQPTLRAKALYQQDFEGGDTDGWFDVTHRGDIRDALAPVEVNGNTVASSHGPWWSDPNHIAPGAGWLNLLAMRDATTLPIGEFTDLVFTFTIDLDGLALPPGASIHAFFQTQDTTISWGRGNYVNYVNVATPITASGTYEIRFAAVDTDWLALGSSWERSDTYGISRSVADALAGVPLDFGLVMLRGDADPTSPLTGAVTIDDIRLDRAGAVRAFVDPAHPLDLQPLDLDLDMADVDDLLFSGATLTISGTSAASGLAIGIINDAGAGVTLSEGMLAIGGTVVAEVSGGHDGVPLLIRFTADTTSETVETLLGALAVAPGSGELSGLAIRFEDVTGNAASIDVLLRARPAFYDGSGDDRVIGGNGPDALRGGEGNDWLEGGAGDDRLNGGPGHDTLIGGEGDDVYYVDDAADVIVEHAGGGIDHVYAATGYTLAPGAEVETLGTYDIAGSEAIDLTGNGFANLIYGNDGTNRLDGGDGDDQVYGFAGDDTLIGGNGNDELVGGEGNDRLAGGTGNDILIGGNGDDRLDGSDGNDQMNGGSGIDTMAGGAGNDSYYVDDAADVVVELAGEGNDRVYATTSYALAPDAAVEWLTAYDIAGSEAIDLTGNGFANLIYGNDGTNRLDGGDGDDQVYGFAGDDTLIGGNGNDELVGGEGSDTFVFDVAPAAGNADTIVDFTPGADRIALDILVFSGLDEGVLASDALRIGSSGAIDGSDRLIYDPLTGSLYYDGDGDQAAFQAVRVASLTPGLALTASDFVVI